MKERPYCSTHRGAFPVHLCSWESATPQIHGGLWVEPDGTMVLQWWPFTSSHDDFRIGSGILPFQGRSYLVLSIEKAAGHPAICSGGGSWISDPERSVNSQFLKQVGSSAPCRNTNPTAYTLPEVIAGCKMSATGIKRRIWCRPW